MMQLSFYMLSSCNVGWECYKNVVGSVCVVSCSELCRCPQIVRMFHKCGQFKTCNTLQCVVYIYTGKETVNKNTEESTHVVRF